MGAAIADVIRERDRTIPQVARGSGVPERTLYRIVRGETKSVKDQHLVKLAEELDVPLSRLVGPRRGIAEDPGDYSPVVAVPVIDQEASASLRGGVVLDNIYLPNEAVPEHRRRDTLALRVRGNCLAPDIMDGDTVIVDLAATPESGNPVVASVDNLLHVKRLRVKSSGRWYLTSNEGELEIEPRQVDGVVVGLYRAMGPRLRMQGT